jgi:mRNA interferase RelE/StbE
VPLRTKFHPQALKEFLRLDRAVQKRIRLAVLELERLDDATVRLVPYAANLKGFWKFRVGDYRIVCELKQDRAGQVVLFIHFVHRSEAYLTKSVATVQRRSKDES